MNSGIKSLPLAWCRSLLQFTKQYSGSGVALLLASLSISSRGVGAATWAGSLSHGYSSSRGKLMGVWAHMGGRVLNPQKPGKPNWEDTAKAPGHPVGTV